MAPQGTATDAERVALLIGGSRGIGLASAAELARRGFRIVLAARDTAALQRAAASIGASASAISCDVTRPESVSALFEELADTTDRLSVLVNSAGIAVLGGLAATPPEQFARLVDVNLVGVYRCIFHARELLERGRGLVINVLSRAGRQPYPNALAYGSAKAALTYLTRALSLDLASSGVRVMGVSPGAVATELRRAVFPDEDPSRLMQPEAVGRVIGAMADDELAHVNGAVIDMPW